MRLESLASASLRPLLLVAAIAVVAGCGPDGRTARTGQDLWEPVIRMFEENDRRESPPKQGIVFIGSASIRRWDLDRYFPDLPVINRGFGGSQIADCAYFADRIILPYEPKTVVLHAGNNDIRRGKTPQQVLADYNLFVETVHEALPTTRIAYISINPDRRHWDLVDKLRKANQLMAAVTEKDERLVYVDADTPMIGEDGKPRPELFTEPDGVHLSAEGYELWTSLLRPHLRLE